ncbi:LacI family DNA-binding transcriptional regulator [Roseimarinus sediminis]|uniref:LacI family DNA-binding transcriptional regulator n=1 Tax=Roseimarinus sediminis TaxID=1610899 RepID=UPI003D1DD4EE
MKKETTIYDIARELKLSASTVSRALKGSKVINSETRIKVQQCAEELGYRSNSFARNLRTQRTNTIGIIVPRLDSSFMSACLAGMEEVCNERGFNTIISQSRESVEREAQNSITMFNNRVDGVIVSLTAESSDLSYFKRFDEKQVPLVFFDRVPENTRHMSFVIDNFRSAYDATRHLIEQGCSQLVHLTLNSTSNVYIDRKKGFEAAVNDCGNCSGKVVFLDSLTFEKGKEVAQSLLAKLPDGIFAANDIVAAACIVSLTEKGIKIPDELAVVGFNNDPVASIVQPGLTTVAYPGKRAGMLAAGSLIECIKREGEPSSAGRREMLKAQLIIRASSIRKTNNNNQ